MMASAFLAVINSVALWHRSVQNNLSLLLFYALSSKVRAPILNLSAIPDTAKFPKLTLLPSLHNTLTTEHTIMHAINLMVPPLILQDLNTTTCSTSNQS